MRLFDRFKKKTEGQKESGGKTDALRVSIFDTDYHIDRNDWEQVYSACVGPMVVIQKAFAEQVVKDMDWFYDFGEGTIRFGADVYPMQFIGSEAERSNTWMWGWHNINGFDDKLLKLANEINQTGREWDFDVFTTECFSLDEELNGHNLSMVACALSKENYCYYRCPHDHGAVFAAVCGVPDQVFAPVGAQDFIMRVLECIRQLPVNHRILIESLLMWNGTPYEWKENVISAHFGTDVHIEFEEAGDRLRVSGITTKSSNGVEFYDY